MAATPEARPAPWLAAALAGPAVALALVVTAGATWLGGEDLARIEVGAPSDAGFVRALRGGDVEEAFAFLQAGQEPNRPVEVTDDSLSGGETLRVAPLVLAVALNNESAVAMLLSHGAGTNPTHNRHALCLATDRGHAAMRESLARLPVASEPTCPDALPAGPMLQPYAERETAVRER